MKEYKGKVFHSQEEVLALCDTIVNSEGWSYPTFIYDCVVKITEGSNISYKLYRRTIGYYYFDSIEKNIEVISYGLYSKGLFRDTLDSDFHKLIQLEEESDREKRHKAKQISKRRDRQHRGKYCI